MQLEVGKNEWIFHHVKTWLFCCVFLVLAARADAETMIIIESEPNLSIELSDALVDYFPVKVMDTKNEFTDGVSRFKGISMSELMTFLNVKEQGDVTFSAYDRYAVTLPRKEFDTYGVILAYEQDGKRLSRRTKGPFWLMYPLDKFDDLQNAAGQARLIWQVNEIVFHE